MPKFAFRAETPTRSHRRTPTRTRAWEFILLTLGAGVVSGTLALVGPGVVTKAGAEVPKRVAATTSQPIQASTLYPPVGAQHQVIDVYDPPPAAAAPVAGGHEGEGGDGGDGGGGGGD